MFEGIRDRTMLLVVVLRMHDIKVKLLKGERLTLEDEEELKLNLLGEDPRREFRDEKQRDRLLAQWWKGVEILKKKLEEDEKKAKA